MDDAGIGRQEIPTRGAIPCLSGCTSESEYLWPVRPPTGLAATTGASATKPGAMSRFTRRPNSSVMGALYSQRTPAFNVSPGLILQSSVM